MFAASRDALFDSFCDRLTSMAEMLESNLGAKANQLQDSLTKVQQRSDFPIDRTAQLGNAIDASGEVVDRRRIHLGKAINAMECNSGQVDANFNDLRCRLVLVD